MKLSVMAIGIVLVVAAEGTPVLGAEPGDKVARASIAEVPPVIDGRLDDAVWAGAIALDGFIERTPTLRGVPAEATSFRLLVDGEALYVAVSCEDSQPQAIRARTMQRDSEAIFDDDAISIKIDPTRDRRTTYGFALNPAGGRMDYRGLNEETMQIELDLVWDGAAVRHDHGWSAELRIPWTALGIDPSSAPPLMGFDVTRDHSRLHATWDWALVAPPHEPFAASQFGVVAGLPELLARAPRNGDRKTWALLPWGLIGYEDRPGADIELVADGGLDVEAELGNGFNGTLTLNTDFAQVEVDDVVTNLGRFDLFLPEKRDFFLKDGDLFSFGEPGWATLFHSRTIGLAQADDGSVEVPILAGLRLGGRTGGGFRLGALSVLTRPTGADAGAQPWRLDSVVRLQQSFSDGSALGMMATHRQSLEDAGAFNVTLGADGEWHHGCTPLVVRAFAAGSADDGATGASRFDGATMIDLRWPGELFYPRAAYVYFGPSFRPGLGFFERTGIHNAWAFLGLGPRLGVADLEKLELWTEGDFYFAAPGGQLVDWRADGGAALTWDAGYWVKLWGRLGEETVGDFAIAGRYQVAAGEHGRTQVHVAAGTPTTEAVSIDLGAVHGDYFGGTITGVGGTLVLRPGTALRATIAAEMNWVSLPGGDFDAPTLNLHLASGLTSELELAGFIGWSGLESLVSFQSRLRWTFAPGNDLFAVWELALDDDTGRAGTHSLVAKLALRWP